MTQPGLYFYAASGHRGSYLGHGRDPNALNQTLRYELGISAFANLMNAAYGSKEKIRTIAFKDSLGILLYVRSDNRRPKLL
jgi:hypothetical protein